MPFPNPVRLSSEEDEMAFAQAYYSLWICETSFYMFELVFNDQNSRITQNQYV